MLRTLTTDEIAERREWTAFTTEDPDELWTLARDEAVTVVRRLALNAICPDALLTLLTHHPDELVRRNVRIQQSCRAARG